ncbi:integral membrane protein [Siccirubricoccus deserti]|uniref:DMT family transporter n=1 Tax=Siccirubricoccus deserti TaxID=2013562 RepID=A0A9X0R062_9PROT|nr:DMT family transporter [Siccirubricoccus deserti]MBC4017074.1 DMT family transporter [Siccirubricoccus deserti]GGC56346.1 integral membrane protein [Siccirubricoccus deserti]
MAGFGLGLLFVAIWASAFTAIKGLVPEWPPLWGVAARFALVVPVLALVLAVRGVRLPQRGDIARLTAMGVFGTAGYLAPAWMASAVLPSGLVALLSSTAPLFVAAGEALVLRQRVPPLAWAGLGLGWLGVAVLGAGRGLGDFHAAEGWAVLLALGGALSQAVGLLCFAPARGRVDAWTANFGQTTVAAVTLLLLAGLLEPRLPGVPSLTAALSLLYGVLVVGVGGYALYFVMLKRLPPATAAALQLLAPPLAAVFGWALLGERLAWTDLAGGAVTLTGLAVLFQARR